jgi:hypothetical protein
MPTAKKRGYVNLSVRIGKASLATRNTQDFVNFGVPMLDPSSLDR